MSASSEIARPAPRLAAGARGVVAVVASAAATALGVLGYRVLVHDHGQAPVEAGAQVAVAWTFLASGLVASWRLPQSIVGPLLAAAGVALLLRRLQYSDDSTLFTLGFALGEASNALIAHAVLAYPSGRLHLRVERVVVAAGYVLVLAFPLATLLVHNSEAACMFDCDAGARARSLLLVASHEGIVDALRDGYRIAVFGVLGVTFVALVLRRLVTAGPAGRRLLAPLLLAALVAGVRVVSEGALTFTSYSESTRQLLFWWQVSVQGVLPVALLVGLLQARLAHATVADRLPELGAAPPGEIRDVLARALGDPSLEVVFWLPESEAYVDEAGARVPPPLETEVRAVTRIEHEGESVAALVHDPELRDEPGLVEAAAAAARLALENARLQAELQAQLAAVRESRARIVSAADEERRRIERDLHDGAQQRLLALALTLRTAERRYAGTLDSGLEHVLAAAVGELQAAVEDLRQLSQGLHPAVLAEQGVGPAVETLAARTPIPVEVRVGTDARLPPVVEAAAYFVVCEALANVVKHAWASAATVRVAREGRRLRVEVADDGAGGADEAGSGLRGLADRVEALGGRLRVVSPPGGGTRVIAEVPCGS